MQLTTKQMEGLKLATEAYCRKDPYVCISGYAGAGKAQPINTIIPTPEGNKQLKDLKVGDYVFDRLGKPTKVLGIFPQGKKEVYQITLQDGRTTLCCKDHLWSYWTSKGNLCTKTTEYMLNSGLQRPGRNFKYCIPTMTNQIEFALKPNLPVDPYIVGAFLGDGCCKERQLTFSSSDEELVAEISFLLGAEDYKRNSDNNYNWTFFLPLDKRSYYNNIENTKFLTHKVFQGFEEEIITKAENKKIPIIYKYASIEDRYALVQGLLDTDGSISRYDGKYSIRFTSISLNLIQDLQEVLYSLGYGSNISKDNRSEKYSTSICYSLNINISNQEKYKLFRLSRKKSIALQAKGIIKKHKYDRTSIVDIRPLGYEEEMLCIKVDNNEELYLTNDYIVTHNTTLVRFIIDNLNLDPEKEVAYVAFTGKSAEVLRTMGNPGAITAHKLLYSAKQKANGQYAFYPRKTLRNHSLKLIVADEVSMLPKTMWDLLLRHKIFVLATGDPFQLPPVVASDDNHILDAPHVFLDEIMRQAKESEIIRLSMNIREMKPIRPELGKEIQVFRQEDITADMLTWADQIITATNETRANINNLMRRLANRGDKPEVGDKIICLRNSWGVCSDQGNPLVNGSIGWIKEAHLEKVYYRFSSSKKLTAPVLYATIDNGIETYTDVPVDYNTLINGKKTFSPKQEYVLRKWDDNPELPIEFDYGYAITCHRAQGSQWNKVLVYEERFPFNRIEHARWLYTAVTRPSEKLILGLR